MTISRSLLACLCLCLCLTAGSSAVADERVPELHSLQPGVRMSLIAEHPALATPTGLDVDAQGRVWLVATHTHFRPDNYTGPEHDEILVFSTQHSEGAADQRHVFYNRTVATMDLELGEDGWVYLAERDRILRIRDTDDDGTADVEESIVSLETAADYPHNGLEGLAWHPDGDLIFGLGENFAQPWTLTGRDQATISGTGEGGIFRCEPDGSSLRRIARGFWNPFGICVRDDGEIFAAENDPGERPPCRLLHVVPGGDYGYQRNYGPEAHHPFVAWNGELRGTLPMIHPSGEAPCGVLPLGQGLLVPSWSDHRIDFFRLQRQGASFSADRIALVQGSRYFRPACIASAEGLGDGSNSVRSWYLTDWVDGQYQAHGFGRLWKLQIDLDQAGWVGSLQPEPLTESARLVQRLRSGKTDFDSQQLLQLAQDPDPFVARAALLSLVPHTSRWTPPQLAGWPAADRIQAVLALKLADADAEVWVPQLLADENPEVRFETLRWISDSTLTQFLPAVQQLLTRSDPDYRLFEAAMATWNTLQGKPEDGIRNPGMLLARVQDPDSPPRLRAYALRLLPTQPRAAPDDGATPVKAFPDGLTLPLLKDLLTVDDPTLSLEVVRTLADNPPAAQQLLAEIAADSRQSDLLRAEAVAGLAAVASGHTDLLLQLADEAPDAVREEALRSLRFVKLAPAQLSDLQQLAHTHPHSADLVQAVLDPQSLAQQRPPLQDTAGWQAALNNVSRPADPVSGRRIFYHAQLGQCANCHRHHGRGNVVGPDLSQVGDRQDQTWLLQSILEPSRQMAPEYQPRTLVLHNGQTFTGIRLRSSTHEAMRDSHGQNRTFHRDEIESMIESRTSFMPDGLVNSLTTRELRDLLAFLQSAPGNP